MDNAINILQCKKYRITEARKSLLHALTTQNNPCTIQELSKLTNSDEATVYRNIELFTKENIVEVITITDSLPRYALSHGHHHHVVCTSCKIIAHIPCDQTTIQPVKNDSFAHIVSHEVTYYGLCKNCASS